MDKNQPPKRRGFPNRESEGIGFCIACVLPASLYRSDFPKTKECGSMFHRAAIIGTTITLILILSLHGQQSRNSGQSPTIKVDVDLTLVNATVTDPQGRVVTGLEREHSDGEDNRSRYTFSNVREFLRERDVQIFAIGIVSDWGSRLGVGQTGRAD
jgi:hypothetical protein